MVATWSLCISACMSFVLHWGPERLFIPWPCALDSAPAGSNKSSKIDKSSPFACKMWSQFTGPQMIHQDPNDIQWWLSFPVIPCAVLNTHCLHCRTEGGSVIGWRGKCILKQCVFEKTRVFGIVDGGFLFQQEERRACHLSQMGKHPVSLLNSANKQQLQLSMWQAAGQKQ